MPFLDQHAPRVPHLPREFRSFLQDSDGGRQLPEVFHAVEKSGLAFLNQFTPGAQVGGHNCSALRIRLENALA